MNLLELIGIIFIIALIFNIVIAIFALKSAEPIKNIDFYKEEI
jgi:hypothetical protein